MLTIGIATQSNQTSIIWIGIALNGIASIIIIFSKTHDDMARILLNDIKNIQNGNYIDESMLINQDNTII